MRRYDRWRDFHRANPQVFNLFEHFARQALNKGHRKRFGARMIGERIRWYTSIETSGDDYRLNDHYWPYYARLLMLLFDEFAGFFEIRNERFDATDAEIVAAHRTGKAQQMLANW